jgi:hypothetical protein
LRVDGIDGKNRVLADVRVSVFEARAADGDQRLKHFDVFGYLLQKSECRASNIFIGVLLSERDRRMPENVT